MTEWAQTGIQLKHYILPQLIRQANPIIQGDPQDINNAKVKPHHHFNDIIISTCNP